MKVKVRIKARVTVRVISRFHVITWLYGMASCEWLNVMKVVYPLRANGLW